MKQRLDILKWLMPLAVLLATACGHDDLVPDDVYEEEPPAPYVEIRIAIPAVNPAGTRANPMGGEEGNGRELGVLKEDIIHDINVFFYKDVAGLDGADDTPIRHHLFFNIKNMLDDDNAHLVSEPIFDSHYLNLKFDLDVELANLGEGTKFAIVANIGGSLQDAKINKLKDLRNLDLSKFSNTWSRTFDAYSNNAGKMDYFLMSTAYNSDYLGTGTNTITKDTNGKYTGSTTVERMYARIDLWYNKEKNAITENVTVNGEEKEKVKELKYDVIDTRDNSDTPIKLAKVFLTNVFPVNVMQTPSYLFKKVTSAEGNYTWTTAYLETQENSVKWGGVEKVSNDEPINYVLEWHTTHKNSTGKTDDQSKPDIWYGGTAKSKVIEKLRGDIGGELAGYYDAPRSKPVDDNGNDCDHISIISYANENTQGTDCFHPNYLTGLAFRAIYVPENIYDKNFEPVTDKGTGMTVIYRFSPTALNTDAANEDEKTEYHVKESESIYFADKDAYDTYMQAHPGIKGEKTVFNAVWNEEEEKWGFICYYNLWLRHYNDEAADPQKTYPMEYATVRNNIYRVKVDFTGPGDPTPTMREPDTMKARIFVRPWNYREENKIFFD